MLLPDKSQVHRSQILERKVDIEQGKALSSKLDQLRRLVADEEVNLRKAREANVLLLQQQIAEYVVKRDEALHEYETAKRLAEEPNQSLAMREKRVLAAEEKLNILSQKLSTLSKELELRRTHISLHESQAEEALRSAKKQLADAECIVATAEKDAKELRTQVQLREKAADAKFGEADMLLEAVKFREAQSFEKQKYLSEIAEAQRREQHRLSLRERAIIDREEALARELKRQVKKIIN